MHVHSQQWSLRGGSISKNPTLFLGKVIVYMFWWVNAVVFIRSGGIVLTLIPVVLHCPGGRRVQSIVVATIFKFL